MSLLLLSTIQMLKCDYLNTHFFLCITLFDLTCFYLAQSQFSTVNTIHNNLGYQKLLFLTISLSNFHFPKQSLISLASVRHNLISQLSLLFTIIFLITSFYFQQFQSVILTMRNTLEGTIIRKTCRGKSCPT